MDHVTLVCCLAHCRRYFYEAVPAARRRKMELLDMPDYKNEPAGVEALMPWSEFIKERWSGVMDTKTETPENRGKLPI